MIINLGTPDSPSVADVRKYLREFLMDARVIDIPFWRRFLLINLIIAPFRAPQSAKGYHELWTAKGSPLKVYGIELERLLQQALGADFEVKLAMRYQSPSIRSVLSHFKDKGFKAVDRDPFISAIRLILNRIDDRRSHEGGQGLGSGPRDQGDQPIF